MPVHVSTKHKDHVRGDPMYDMTRKIGKTTVHFVAPPPMTPEEQEKTDKEIHAAAWAILERIERDKEEKNLQPAGS